jgi:ribosomal-protein-alanine N-acetyltransferase
MAGPLALEPMAEADVELVMAIQREAGLTPWSGPMFLDELARAWARLDVAREPDGAGGQQVVGFSNYWLVHDEVHLLAIAVRADRRRRGHARCLLERVIGFARDRECQVVVLEVRRSNLAAIELYRGFGFAAVGVRAGYYPEGGEDALVMTLALDGEPRA